MPTVEWTPGNSAGAHTGPVTKLVLHTTEGSSIEGACASYKANNSWPHTTCAPAEDRICRHLGYNVAARSLKNLSGGVQTNTGGCIQVEVVGSATDPDGIDWEWVGREVVGPICREVGIPIESTVVWVTYPESYGLRAPQRLSGAQWVAYVGVLGHQHVPENDHGDPGGIPIAAMLAAATGVPVTPLPAPQEDLMPVPVIDVPDDPQRNTFLALYLGGYETLDSEEYQAGVAAGLLAEVKHVSARQYDVAADLTKRLAAPVAVEVDEEAIAGAVVDALPPLNMPGSFEMTFNATGAATAVPTAPADGQA